MMRTVLVAAAAVACKMAIGDVMVISDAPSVVRNAEWREAIRQDSTWTAENIRANPYLFLQDQIRACDQLRAKIEAQSITLVRIEKEADRKVEDATAMITRYEKFLADAKNAYKVAPSEKKFPIAICGCELDEDGFNERCSDAMDRVETAKKEKTTNEGLSRKVKVRKGVLKAKLREVRQLREKLTQQAEQVKTNAALAEIGNLKGALGMIHDMMLEIDEDPSKLSLDDMTAEDPNAKRDKRVNAFLNNS